MNRPTELVCAWLDAAARILRRDRLFVLCVLGGLATLAVGVVCNDRPGNDVASCYAPEVREFALANWTGAFFHMTPPLVIVAAGALAALGVPAFGALKAVSALLFLAGLWPLSRLLRRLLPADYVSWGCLLYIASPRLLRYAVAGTLESAKLFFLLWAIVLLLDGVERGNWKRWVALAAALAGLSLSRADGVFFLPFFAAGMVFLALWNRWRPASAEADDNPAGAHQGKTLTTRNAAGLRPPAGSLLRSLTGSGGRILALFALVLLFCLPQLWYIYKATGAPALDSRQTWRMKTLLAPFADESPAQSFKHKPNDTTSARPVPEEDQPTAWRSVRETFKGLDMFWLALAAIGVILRLRRRSWSREESVFLALIVYNAVLFAANGFITKRYTATTAPFLLAWAVPAAVFLRHTVLNRIHRHAFSLVVAVVVLAGAWSGLAKVRSVLVGKPNPERRFGAWVVPNRARLLQPDAVSLVSHPVLPEYHNGRRPIVAAAAPQYAYWAEGDWAILDSGYIHPLSSVMNTLTRSRAELVVVDGEFRAICPEFTGELPGFSRLQEPNAAPLFEVYQRTGPLAPVK